MNTATHDMSPLTASQSSQPEKDFDDGIPYEREKTILWNPLFWICLLMAGSAYQQLRFTLGGMSFHPYMMIVGLLIFRAAPRLHFFPSRVGRPAALFLLLYVLSLIQGTRFLHEIIKIGVMAFTLVIIAISVRSKEDFIAGAYGLGACATALSIKGFIRGVGTFGSINPIEGSQKNAFSLFYLPALTVCMCLLMSGMVRLNRKTVLACIIAVMFGAIALSRNRSGWLASGVLLFLLFGTNRARLKMMFLMGFVILMAYGLSRYVLSGIDRQERDAVNAEASDNLRLHLLERAVTIGLQNPFLGVSPTKLTRMLASSFVSVDVIEGIDCHNLTGYLIGGCGLTTFAAFCLFCFAMARPPGRARGPRATRLMKESSRMLTIMVIIWVIRAQFQEDVLFSPTFAAGLGLCIGFCVSSGVYGGRASGEQVAYVQDEEQRELDQTKADHRQATPPYDLPKSGSRPLFGSDV